MTEIAQFRKFSAFNPVSRPNELNKYISLDYYQNSVAPEGFEEIITLIKQLRTLTQLWLGLYLCGFFLCI